MKKYITKKLIIVIILFIVLILLGILIYINPLIHIDSKKHELSIDVNEKYNLPKVKAYFLNKDITYLLTKEGKINNKKIGVYKIKYKVKYMLLTKSINVIIKVVDRDSPVIDLVGDKEVKVCPNKKYEEEGYKATDNYDKDITNRVLRKEYKDYIKYSVKDKSNNKTDKKRYIIYVDSEIPEIKLKGSSTIQIQKNTSYKESGYTSIDNCDGDITDKVETINNIDINKTGSYYVLYKVKDTSGNEKTVKRIIKVIDTSNTTNSSGLTYIKGILLVNKKYSLPSDYGNGVNSEAYNAYLSLKHSASLLGYSIPFLSGYRSYNTQQTLYNNYVARDGEALANTYSAKPGYSEHQTGLAFDVGQISDNYGNTSEGIWLKNNAHLFGFIIRYPQGKTAITGYQYEPWHIRYVGISHATNIYNAGLTLEEYLGV